MQLYTLYIFKTVSVFLWKLKIFTISEKLDLLSYQLHHGLRWLSILDAPILDVLIQSEIRLCSQATQNYFAHVYAVFHNFKIAFLLEETGPKAKHLELAGRVIQIQTENFNI